MDGAQTKQLIRLLRKVNRLGSALLEQMRAGALAGADELQRVPPKERGRTGGGRGRPAKKVAKKAVRKASGVRRRAATNKDTVEAQ